MKRLSIHAAWLLALGLMLSGCTRTEHTTTTVNPNAPPRPSVRVELDENTNHVTSQEVQKETGEAWQALSGYMAQERDKFMVEAEQARQRLDAKIRELEAQSRQSSGTEKQRTDREIKDLRLERRDVDNVIGQMKSASQGTWTRIKAGWQTLEAEVRTRLNRDGQAAEPASSRQGG